MSKLQQLSKVKCFGGWLIRYSHQSDLCQCEMKFQVYLPPAAEHKTQLPVITEYNLKKSGFQRYAAEHSIVVVTPDTSPRGLNLPGDSESWDFGVGAGFYVDATQEPWSSGYKMYSYVTQELRSLVESELPVSSTRRSISGHSMGGHGALVSALKNPGLYLSCSAFAPISHPTAVPWGVKAFTNFLGSVEAGKEYDAAVLAAAYKGPDLHFLVDQGLADNFLEPQLSSAAFEAACKDSGLSLELRAQPGYDHSYYFVASFIGDHIQHHARFLNA